MKAPKVTHVFAVLALLVTVGIAAATAVKAFGEQTARVGAVEQRQVSLENDIRDLREKIDGVAVSQSATQSTVEAIKDQQRVDRDHIDARLNDVMRAIERSR